jgi:hypothetical protein
MENEPRYKEDEATSWLWAGCWLLFIYVTIPLARPIQEFVRDHGGKSLFLIATFAAFAVAAILLIRSVWRGALSCRPAGMVVLGAIFGLFCSMTWGLRANPEESLHFVQYGVLSMLLFRALHHRVRDPSVYIAAAMLGTMFGILDELIQWMVPRRFFDYRDIGINVMAVLLVQLAIAVGIRPPSVRRPFSRPGVRIACAAVSANLVLLLFCVSNTDGFKAWYSDFIPAAQTIDEVTATYGFLIDDPAIGVFYSRLRPEALRRQDRERAVEVAAILDEYKPERRYERFLRTYPAYSDPFLVEARVHLFRRDRHGSLAIKKSGDPEAIREHVHIAYRENQILRAYFPETLARSAYAWEPHIEQVIESMIDNPPPYDSPVSRYVITRFTQYQLASVLLTLLVLLGVGYRWTMRRLAP